MHFLYITVLHFHMYFCYMLINESVSQLVEEVSSLICNRREAAHVVMRLVASYFLK